MIDALHQMNMMFVLFRTGAFATSVKRDPTCWASSPRIHEAPGGMGPAARMAVRCALCKHWCDTGADVQLYEWHPQCVCRTCFDEVSDTFMGAFLPMMVAVVRLELPPYWLNRVFRDWLYGQYLWEERPSQHYGREPWSYNVPAIEADGRYRKFESWEQTETDAVIDQMQVKIEPSPEALTRGPVPRGRSVQWRSVPEVERQTRRRGRHEVPRVVPRTLRAVPHAAGAPASGSRAGAGARTKPGQRRGR